MKDCTICGKELSGLTCLNEWCNEQHYECSGCHKILNGSDIYEYRGALGCAECIDAVRKNREQERQEIIAEESAKTECFKGLGLGDSVIGKANREILKPQIEIAGKESARLKAYEGRDK